MTNEIELQELLDDSVKVMRRIQEIKEGELSQQESLLSAYKSKLEKGLSELNLKTVETENGKVTLVSSKGKSKLDVQAIADKLGLDDLKEFKKLGNPYDYILITAQKIISDQE